jgi:hypothetical protein
MLHQGVDKIATAVDQEVLAGLLLQFGYFIGDIIFDQRCISLGLFQGP